MSNEPQKTNERPVGSRILFGGAVNCDLYILEMMNGRKRVVYAFGERTATFMVFHDSHMVAIEVECPTVSALRGYEAYLNDGWKPPPNR